MLQYAVAWSRRVSWRHHQDALERSLDTPESSVGLSQAKACLRRIPKQRASDSLQSVIAFQEDRHAAAYPCYVLTL
jgi:hypothetical protein